MKFFFKKRGFTLVELMIVIAIIGLLIAAMSSFNSGASISQQKLEKWANEVSDMIRDARQAAILGKNEKTAYTGSIRQIIFTIGPFDASMGIGSDYRYFLTGSNAGAGPTMKDWFQAQGIEGDKDFKIEKIETSKNPIKTLERNVNAETYYAWAIARRLNLSFDGEKKYAGTGAIDNNPSVVSYRITLNYKNFRRYIFGSVYSGNVEIRNQLN